MSFRPSDPLNAFKTMQERQDYEEQQRAKKRKERLETRRYWITTGIAIAALILAVLSLLLQIPGR